jgi:hypothetical protein
MGNAVIQRIALHPNAIERNVFCIAWQSPQPARRADKSPFAGYCFLEQQKSKGRQEKGRGGLTQGLSRALCGYSSFTEG